MALAMQAAMADLAEITISQGILLLSMKIGLQRGRFFAAQLGTPHSMEYALFGACRCRIGYTGRAPRAC